MTDDRDDLSEQLDDDKLGEGVGADDQPGGGDYPPDEPLGVDDPTLEGEDDLATRQLRREAGDGPLAARAPVPVEPDPGESPNDEEERMLAETAAADDPVPPAEEAALHVEEPPPDA